MINHPAKGSVVTIEPLRTLTEVTKVKAVLTDPQDIAVFTLGVNTNLRASDLLALTVADVDWVGSKLILKESKTGKKRTIPLSAGIMALLHPIIPADGGYLFPSNKSGKPLTMSAWNNKVKLWCRKAGLKGNYGARTIRKTWARLQYEVFKTPLVLISMELNHSSLRDTYRYMGITPPEIEAVYKNFI